MFLLIQKIDTYPYEPRPYYLDLTKITGIAPDRVHVIDNGHNADRDILRFDLDYRGQIMALAEDGRILEAIIAWRKSQERREEMAVEPKWVRERAPGINPSGMAAYLPTQEDLNRLTSEEDIDEAIKRLEAMAANPNNMGHLVSQREGLILIPGETTPTTPLADAEAFNPNDYPDFQG